MITTNFNRPKDASCIRIRFIIVLMTTLCTVVCYISRKNLSLAVIAMVNHNVSDTFDESLSNLTNHDADPLDSCPLPGGKNGEGSSPISFGPKYDWTPSQKSLLFEAFFLTYVIFQIPGARLAEVAGAKWILTVAAAGSAIISFLTPWAASLNPYALAVLRALMGICQTALFPAGYVLYTQWLPPAERSQALPVLGTGAFFGAIITSGATGYFNGQPELGWEHAFYMPGVACAIWSIVWIILGTSEPRQHRFISSQELDYIESRREVSKSDSPKTTISWRKVLTSWRILIMCIGFFASNWSFMMILIHIPSYLNFILKVPQLENGLINSIIYALFAISSPIVGFVSTWMVEKRTFGLTRLQIRKVFQGFAVFGQAICFLLLPLLGCDTYLVVVVLFSQIVLLSLTNGGEVQMPAELSVDFAGTIYAMGNCVGSATGFIVPRVHSLMVTDISSRTAWNSYFYLSSAIISMGGIIFVIFAQNDLQDYSKKSAGKKIEIKCLDNIKSSQIVPESSTASLSI